MAKEKIEQSRLKKMYNEVIVPAMMKDFDLKNKMAVPMVRKVSVNVGVGKMAAKDSSIIEKVAKNIASITGQKPVIKKARMSVAGFKLREGQNVGVFVTLRGNRMYEFLDRLINIALPRVRDFRGLKLEGFDQQGNYSIGVKEHTIFPEITGENIESAHGLQINITLNKSNKEMGTALLRYFGFPLKQ